MKSNTFKGNTFLSKDDPSRKDVSPSSIAVKAIAKAPPNLAVYDSNGELHEVVAHALKIARDHKQVYEMQRQSVWPKWTKADEAYWMAMKDDRMPEMTWAKTSASAFYRTSRALADGAYLATFNDDMPMKFFPEISPFDESEEKTKVANIADALNRWAGYCMKRTKLADKMRQAYYQVYKYGNFIAHTPYDYRVEKRKKWENVDVNETFITPTGTLAFRHRETGEESDVPYPFEVREAEYDYPCKDEVGFHPIPIESCWLDDRIEDLDRQTCFLWRSDLTRPEIWAEARAGKFKNVDRINEAQALKLFGQEGSIYGQRKYDAEKVLIDSTQSEVYERWQIWLLLPKIDVKFKKNGEISSMSWDQNAESRRYVMDVVGGLVDGEMVVVNFSESPYWTNGIPFVAGHSHQDDSGFYHRGLIDLLQDNMVQEKIAKGQMLDNRSLMNFRPMIRLQGRVKNKDIKIGPNTVFDVSSPDALKQMDIGDLAQSNNYVMSMIREDSEKIAQTPSFMLGQAMGGRTSATEFAAIRDQASSGALYDIKALNYQIIGGYMRKLHEYAPQFIDRDIAMPDVGESVSPDEFSKDFRIKDVAVQDFENKTVVRQELINLTQIVFANPAFAGFINPAGWLVKLCSLFKEIFPNPEEMLVKSPQVQSLLIEYQKQSQAALNNSVKGPEVSESAEGENPQNLSPGTNMAGGPIQQAPSVGVMQALPVAALAGAAGGV